MDPQMVKSSWNENQYAMEDKDNLETAVSTTTSQNAETNVLDPYGRLHRGLKERHIQFIAIGGTIGTGLFLGIGGALATAGPLSLFLGYSISSVFIWIMVRSIASSAEDEAG